MKREVNIYKVVKISIISCKDSMAKNNQKLFAIRQSQNIIGFFQLKIQYKKCNSFECLKYKW